MAIPYTAAPVPTAGRKPPCRSNQANEMADFLDDVRAAASKRVLFVPHAIKQMVRPDWLISPADVEVVASRGEIIEDYADDPSGGSCLLLAWPGDRPVHPSTSRRRTP